MIDSKYQVRRYITVFSLMTDELSGEYDLSHFDLAKFQAEFNEEDVNDPMFDCYPIYSRHVKFIKAYVEQEPNWDFENNAYFLEAHSL